MAPVHPGPDREWAEPRLAIFTICSNNYLPIAKTLLASAARHHPQAEIFLCLADDYIDAAHDTVTQRYPEKVQIVTLDQLAINDLADFTFRYDILELNTAAKPFMFCHLLEQHGFDQIIYLDPDIEVFAPLKTVTDALDAGASLVLTPHICHPSEIGEGTKDIIFLLAGTFNLGFLAVSRCVETLDVLYWWARRLRYDCINNQEAGFFVDQRYMDLIPGFASNFFVSRDPTLNVAYWNVTQRRIERVADGWRVDGKRLTFFHFSGVDPTDTQRLSRHGSVQPKAGTPIRELLENYAAQTLANGFLDQRHTPYAFGTFASGVRIPRCVRQMYRTRHHLWLDNPFNSYEEVLHLPDPQTPAAAYPHVVTNLMRFLHDAMGVGTHSFDAGSTDGARILVSWYIEHAAAQFNLDWRLIAPVEQRLHPRLPDAANVSIIGYFNAATGVGQAGRKTFASLAASENLRCEKIDAALPESKDGNGLVQIFHVNADLLPQVMGGVRPHLPRAAYRIAVPFWELETLPEPWHRSFEGIDEVWASSYFIQRMLQKHLTQPVVYMPLAWAPIEPVQGGREAFGLAEDDFLFFVTFDFHSYMERKNPVAAITAFRQAFPIDRQDKVGLIIKTQNGGERPDDLARLQAEISIDPRIRSIEETLPREQMISLITACDCFLSLHRSEGYGLVVAEAMLLDKPVIATNYGATTDLVTPTTGFPVDYTLIPVAENAYPMASGQIWAEPDTAHAVRLMREVQSNPAGQRKKVEAAREYLTETYRPDKIQAMQLQRLRAAGLGV